MINIHIFLISNKVTEGLTLVENVNAKNFGIGLSKNFYFFNFKFIKAKFLHNFF